jgi:hypothetical protein
VKYAFVFGRVALTVRYWEQRGDDVEAGARVEIRRVEEALDRHHRPGNAGFTVLPVGEGGVWRVDLFTVISAPGHEPRHHHHPHFEDGGVGRRVFEPELSADPLGWTERRLTDLRGLLEGSGAGDLADSVDYDEYAASLPAIRAAIEACLTPVGERQPA